MIQEAVKSGKPFRRKFWKITEGLWLKVSSVGYIVAAFPMGPPYDEDDGYIFHYCDIVADDWETK